MDECGREVAPEDLKSWLTDGMELALLDVREHGQFGEGHMFLATPAPYSQLEFRVQALVPRPGTRVVVVDDNGAYLARLACKRLAAIGYVAVFRLKGGLVAWKQAGYKVFSGVNVPSKAFGELVEHRYNVPKISACELADLQTQGSDVVVLDGRPVPEYQKMSIPAAVCCPNGELALRATDIVKSPDTLVVVNCAGRTRSIVGAQTLIDSGIPNPVRALENGTQGWFLEDLRLDHGASRLYPGDTSQAGVRGKQGPAQDFAKANALPTINYSQFQAWHADADRSTYLCDIRTDEEFAASTLALAIHAPGGQLIQATDHYIGTRNARVVVFDTENVRAVYVAVWLKRMGLDVAVLTDASAHLHEDDQDADKPSADGVTEIGPGQLAECLAARVPVLDLRPGMDYRRLHITGSQWSIRPMLHTLGLQGHGTVALVVSDPRVARLASIDLRECGVDHILVFVWDGSKLQGLACESTPSNPPDAQCIDYLFFVHDRHDGNKEAARRYLSWELGLLEQLDKSDLAAMQKHLN